jgi:NAD(P)-dependent dehydrogenase (short-subunit alcohol dehydrogenase family)
MKLNNKVVVIAGGCGQIGYATAKRLAQQGARIIVLVRRNLQQAHDMMSQLPNPELNHFAIQASIINTNELKLAVEEVTLCAGRCDILINAAGTLNPIPPTELHNLTDEIFDEIVTVNLRGVYATVREFSNLLKNSNDGLIVNLSSQSGQRASNSCIAYAASKAGIDLMTKTLAKSLAPNIRVIGIAPGYLENATSGVTRIIGNEELAASAPLQSLATGDDIARAIEAFATVITHATGTTLLVDGGRLL